MNTIPPFRSVLRSHAAHSAITRHYGSGPTEREVVRLLDQTESGQPGQAKIGGWSEELRDALEKRFGADDEAEFEFLEGLVPADGSIETLPESAIFAALEKI